MKRDRGKRIALRAWYPVEAMKPSQAKPSQAKPSQAKPSQAKPSQAKPSQAKPSQAKLRVRAPEFTEEIHNCLKQVRRPGNNEPTVQSDLKNLFESFGRDAQVSKKVERGEADIHLTDCNVIVEAKASGKAGPYKPGSSRTGEGAKTQLEQLTAYVEGMIRMQSERLDLEGLNSRPWTGVLTDGQRWWAWKWKNEQRDEAPCLHFELRAGQEESAYRCLKNLLYNEDTIGLLRWVPEDTASMFSGEDETLANIYEDSSESSTAKNKQEIWLELLRGSGMAPQGVYRQHRLFIRHTYLVAVARAVVGALTDDTADDDPNEALKDGFVSWVLESEAGREWARGMFEEAFRYDWRSRKTDVLRRFYEHVIPKEDRKAYGEYYTPDWVAELLAKRVLDEEWLESALQAALAHIAGKRPNLDGIGVLDPTCGSGTFLYHAALRLLIAPALQNRSKQSRADCVARLVHGIDVHPVAVEMARATLLRALPKAPTGGAHSLNIAQGDSLLANGVDKLFQEASFPSESVRLFALPRDFLLQENYRQRTEALVESAKRGEKTVPEQATAGFSETVAKAVGKAHKSLRELCAERGNSVWTWLVTNAVAPLRLHVRKVDRILANPPWVRMSDIQVPVRKTEIGQLARDLDLWVGGKNATGFDIGGLFVRRCRDLYGVPDGCAAAWILNWASIRAENWGKFRHWFQPRGPRILDFGEVREPPFPGAKSCAWIERADAAHCAKRRNAIPREVLRNRADIEEAPASYKVLRTDSWPTVSRKCEFGAPPAPPPRGVSGYTEGGKCRFRNGATLFPYCLVLADSCESKGRGRVRFRTRASAKDPWAALGSQEGNVPDRWIVGAAFAKDLLPFCLRREISKAILPLAVSGQLESAPEEKNDYWKRADNLYRERRGKGASTPKSLIRRIDFNSTLSQQLPLERDRPVLAYNASGQYLRAAVCAEPVVFEHGLYWLPLRNATEAHYLAAVLNAPALDAAFSWACKSDRHFDTHIWTAVPIPRYADREPLHRELSDLGMRAAKAARKARDAQDAAAGRIKLSAAIRVALTEDGVLGEIDRAVRKLLPKQTAKRLARGANRSPPPWRRTKKPPHGG